VPFLLRLFSLLAFNIPPFSPQMREMVCQHVVNNSLVIVNKSPDEMRQQFFAFLLDFFSCFFQGLIFLKSLALILEVQNRALSARKIRRRS
jgi:hypothetical protein